jgi:hypothetical protein
LQYLQGFLGESAEFGEELRALIPDLLQGIGKGNAENRKERPGCCSVR